jgi:hypothetical protein
MGPVAPSRYLLLPCGSGTSSALGGGSRCLSTWSRAAATSQEGEGSGHPMSGHPGPAGAVAAHKGVQAMLTI